MPEDKKSVTNRQLILLLETLESDVSFNKANKNNSKKHNLKWNKLVKKLNSIPNGAKKSVAGWKTVLNDWKLTVASQAGDNPDAMNEFESRMLQIIEDEDIVNRIDTNLKKLLRAPRRRVQTEVERENVDVVEGTTPLALRNRSVVTARQEAITLQNERLQAPRTIYSNNMREFEFPEHRITVMQLERLHYVSQDLESHIKNVQDRIQMIKDRWQHECEDDE